MKRILVIIIVSLFVASCGTTAHVRSSWKEPGVSIDMSQLNKVLVLGLFANETNRRAAESQLASMFPQKAIPAHHYFTADFFRKEKEGEIKQILKREGFDGVIVMRLADYDKDITYIPGSNSYPHYYGRFWPYVWTASTQPGHYETTRTFTIETNVYSFRKDKLIWSSLTSSADPKNANKLIDAVGKEVYKKMKQEGFIVQN